MRTALICFFFALIVRKEGSYADQDNDFKPTPIPLNNWTGKNQVKAGTLQEFINTDSPPKVAVIPPHYWEDALRHSVYLTLVRDEIDQLIVKDLSTDSTPNGQVSKDVDDRDLWEKIKSAPFDRVKEEPIPPSDAVILARGKLIEERDGYRFVEGNFSPKKNNNNAVKAYWSVQRLRQIESPGKYHYELTFSVTSQSVKSSKKQQENPVRTFTIKENSPTERARPHSHRSKAYQHDRAQRAVWVHKNIGPNPNYQKHYEKSSGLERLFTSFFSDDDNYDDNSNRQKLNSHYYPQQYQPDQHAKISRYIGEREPHHQKKVYTYPLKLPPFRQSRPPLQPPPITQKPLLYFDMSQDGNSHIHNEREPKPSNSLKTTKQGILPNAELQNQLKFTVNEPQKKTQDVMDYTTKVPETSSTTYKVYTRKKTPIRVNYLPENIRTPIYNAPPGVFVTMDKKPFKPMPPLKSIFPKPHKNLPSDFKPSPQIVDNSFTYADSTAETAFRPITPNLAGLLSSTKDSEIYPNPVKNKKPPKKQDNIKSYRLTTISPDIITAPEDETADLQWAEILAAFTRTTPMASHKRKGFSTQSNFIAMTTAQTTVKHKYANEFPTTSKTTTTATTTTTAAPTTTTAASTTTTAAPTTTTVKPKRTRPPPKFQKPEKNKKHKRVTSTTTSTTTTVTPSRVMPSKKSSDDLTPQASSGAINEAHSVNNKIKPQMKLVATPSTSINLTTTTTTAKTPVSTTTTSTTSRPLTTTTMSTTVSARSPTTTIIAEPIIATKQPKNKNRFRLSMLMQKGTSINYNKWSAPTMEKNRTTTILPTTFTLRRKASKFQGYIASTTFKVPETEGHREIHRDHAFHSSMVTTSSTAPPKQDIEIKVTTTTQSALKETKISNAWINDMETRIEIDTEEQSELSSVKENKDSNEFIFPVISNTDNNSIYDTQNQNSTTNSTVTSPLPVGNKKTKCKLKKQQNLTTSDILKPTSEVITTTMTTPITSVKTTSTTVSDDISDLFEDFLGGFTMDDELLIPKATKSTLTATEPITNESKVHKEVIPVDDDIENFLHSLDQTHEKKNSEEYDIENEHEDYSMESDTDGRDIDDDDDEYYDVSGIQTEESEDRPFSLLELMAME